MTVKLLDAIELGAALAAALAAFWQVYLTRLQVFPQKKVAHVLV